MEAVESRLGRDWGDGKSAVNELVLLFSDGQRLGLRTQENLRRVLEAWGPDTDGWQGRVLEAYFSPDVRNPRGGDSGGIRVRIPDAVVPAAPVSATPTVRTTIELPDDDRVPF